jgi:CubicO group peptidase (beta-lactamase class C family)
MAPAGQSQEFRETDARSAFHLHKDVRFVDNAPPIKPTWLYERVLTRGFSMRRFKIAAAGVLIIGFAGTVHAQTTPSPVIDATPPPPQVAGIPIPPGQIDSAISALDGLAQKLLDTTKIPGLAVAVAWDGKVVHAKGFGVRKAGEPARVDEDTIFQIASMSKSLGASVVAHEVGKGSIGWDTPIAKHLPWFSLESSWVTTHLTIADLYAHRSGLPDHAGDELEDLGYDRRQVLERLRFLPLEPFRSTYAYTNFGMTAAAEAVAAASGTDWATLSERVLYIPLGMSSTSSRFSDYSRRLNRAFPHVKTGDAYAVALQRQPDAQSPAGGVSSSANDIGRWMVMVLQNGRYQGQQVVNADALLQAVTPQIVSSPAYAMDARASFYGYGFGISTQPSGRTTISHSGAFALGAATTYLLIPSANIGIAVLSNAAPTGAVEALAMEFADRVQYGRSTRDWASTYKALFEPLLAPVGELVGKSPPSRPSPMKDLALYAGTYANDYFGDAVIAKGDRDTLLLKLGPAQQVYELTHWDGDLFTFNLRNENANPGTISKVEFSGTPQNVTSLRIEYFTANGLGVFTRRRVL